MICWSVFFCSIRYTSIFLIRIIISSSFSKFVTDNANIYFQTCQRIYHMVQTRNGKKKKKTKNANATPLINLHFPRIRSWQLIYFPKQFCWWVTFRLPSRLSPLTSPSVCAPVLDEISTQTVIHCVCSRRCILICSQLCQKAFFIENQ